MDQVSPSTQYVAAFIDDDRTELRKSTSNLYNFVTIPEILSYGNGILIDVIAVVKNIVKCQDIGFDKFDHYCDSVTS